MVDDNEIIPDTCPVCKVGILKYVMYNGYPYWECSKCDHWDYGDEGDITPVQAPIGQDIADPSGRGESI